jgi:hypothetical protein
MNGVTKDRGISFVCNWLWCWHGVRNGGGGVGFKASSNEIVIDIEFGEDDLEILETKATAQ